MFLEDVNFELKYVKDKTQIYVCCLYNIRKFTSIIYALNVNLCLSQLCISAITYVM